MKRISEALQFAIIIERSWAPPVLEAQLLEKLDFLRRRVSAQDTILEEFAQTRLCNRHLSFFLLDEFEFLHPRWSDSAIQNKLQAE